MILKPKISIIIPNYNNGNWIPSCIDSCLNQKGDFDLEIIIIDDNSTDNSWEILSNYQLKHPKQIKVFKNPSKGGNHARNYGFSQSSGDYIQWLDSDDQLLQNKIKNQLSYFSKDISVVYSDFKMDFYETNLLNKSINYTFKDSEDYLADLLNNKWNAIHSYLFKRDFVEKAIKINGWNPNTLVGQDREFVTKVAIIGGIFSYCKGVYVTYNRWNEQSVSHVSHINNIDNSTMMNHEFYTLIESQANIEKIRKEKYSKILNTELIRNLYYHPKLILPRTIKYKQVNWKDIDWKIRPLLTLLLIKKLILNKNK